MCRAENGLPDHIGAPQSSRDPHPPLPLQDQWFCSAGFFSAAGTIFPPFCYHQGASGSLL